MLSEFFRKYISSTPFKSIEGRLSTFSPKKSSFFEPFECLEQISAAMTTDIFALLLHSHSVGQSERERQTATYNVQRGRLSDI